MNHGHETNEHIRMKILIALLFRKHKWTIWYEHLCCDVVAHKYSFPGPLRVLGIEAERSVRNLVPNIRRNLKHGCDRVLLVMRSERLRISARRVVRSVLSPEESKKVGITTITHIKRAINHE